jgi:ATP-dependent DNA helicase DinG
MSEVERGTAVAARPVLVPRAGILVAGFHEALWLSTDGEIEALAPDEARARALREPPLLCHLPATARRLNMPPFPAFDLLELFAFVYPARFCVPTPRGLAEALGLPQPVKLTDSCVSLAVAARSLLEALGAQGETAGDAETDVGPRALAETMKRGGWLWAAAVLAALPPPDREPGTGRRAAALHVWTRLDEWSEIAPPAPSGHMPVSPEEARLRLAQLLRGSAAEPRPEQADYAAAVATAFAPRNMPGRPHAVLAEAGTGVGKTLGYIASASLWAEKNRGSIWISTFTRNLQSQIGAELDRLYPDPEIKRRRVVVRKGRENFLCLLNYEEAATASALRAGGPAPHLGLIARWIMASEAGDLVAGDFPGWLAELIGRGRVNALADRRGECVHAACPHFRRCFVEKNIRAARQARIVVANHALVMAQAAMGGLDDATVPTRYVFDEGHHLLDAADSAFALRLSGQEGRELRRWIVGAEGARSRARGLRRRIGDLVEGDEEGMQALLETLGAARILPGDGWAQRVAEGRGQQAFESFLVLVRRQVLARAVAAEAGYGLEAEARPPIDGVVAAALPLAQGLERLASAMQHLASRLRRRLEDTENSPDPSLRQRLDVTIRGLDRRQLDQLTAWVRLLRDLGEPAGPDFVEWLALDRSEGLEIDVAVNRNWIDPGRPFAELVASQAHGLVVTSATLTDGACLQEGEDLDLAWRGAEAETGLRHLPDRPAATRIASPFDYRAQTRIFVVDDVPRADIGQVAAAYAGLFMAARGGALGLFTAIARLRAVHQRIAPALEAQGLLLLAQHVDAMSTATLVDIFRAEEDSCLLGTDAVRDGVDVPGRSLRLLVFDRVPWPRPGILQRARRPAFGGAHYPERIARLRLRQAYGRLIRRTDDRGVFAILDRALPSRLFAAFPPGVPVLRLPLVEAAAETARFLATTDPS